MTDKKSNDSRRKLLKSIAAGSGAVVAGKSLPESWTKPVIDSVLLPAHASTSGGDYFGSFSISGEGETPFKLCVQCVGSDCSAKALEDLEYYYQGSGSLGEDMILTQLTDCDDYTIKLKVESVNGVATGQLTLRNGDGETNAEGDFSIPRAPCGLSAADDKCEEDDSSTDEAKSENRR